MYLSDFSEEQVRLLVARAIPEGEPAGRVADRVFYWTSGQPYLTQVLCSYLASNSTEREVGVCVERLRREDRNHLPSILKRVNNSEKLKEYVERVCSGERLNYYPSAHPIQAELEMLGVIKANAEGYCCIRNRLYEVSLGASESNEAADEPKPMGETLARQSTVLTAPITSAILTLADPAPLSGDGKRQFDVFLCHHSVDKPSVKEIGRRLHAKGLHPWLDEWELRPGSPWQKLLEAQIETVKSAAVFVGKDGIGPWQEPEIDAFLREFVRRSCPVIPVVLANAASHPKLPVFLAGMTWVDFRISDPDPLGRLIWGITGKRED